MPMNTEIKARWVARCRTGRQAFGALSINDGFCCLGFLQELAVEDGVTSRTEEPVMADNGESCVLYEDPDGTTSWTYLSPAVVEWAELTSSNPLVTVPGYDGRWALGYVNDEIRLPLTAIAELIDEQL